MSINFSTLQGLTIPEGVVTQITDASGRVLWALTSGDKIVLQVEKITSNTYAGSTTYENEEFILLDIYPKTNGTVNVTYDGLTKTITDTSGVEEPNAQQVFFGTFNGVSDSVATPASGTLTIDGKCIGVSIGTYTIAKGSLGYCSCVTAITEYSPTNIPSEAFYNCKNFKTSVIPEGVVNIGAAAFSMDTYDNSFTTYASDITLPTTLESLYFSTFTAEDTTVSGDYYFYHSDIIFLSPTPPTMSEDKLVLTNYHTVFKVPKGCGKVYREADGWSNIPALIVADGEIGFYVNTVGFIAEEGMTWEEWVNSEWNTNGYYISGNTVLYPVSTATYQLDDVTPSDIIIHRHGYTSSKI